MSARALDLAPAVDEIQRLNRAGESRFRRMAETARLVLIDGEMLVEQHQLPQCVACP